MKPPIEYRNPKLPEIRPMSDAAVLKAALADPDAQPLTKADTARMKRRPSLFFNPDCPACQARRKRNADTVAKHRAKAK